MQIIPQMESPGFAFGKALTEGLPQDIQNIFNTIKQLREQKAIAGPLQQLTQIPGLEKLNPQVQASIIPQLLRNQGAQQQALIKQIQDQMEQNKIKQYYGQQSSPTPQQQDITSILNQLGIQPPTPGAQTMGASINPQLSQAFDQAAQEAAQKGEFKPSKEFQPIKNIDIATLPSAAQALDGLEKYSEQAYRDRLANAPNASIRRDESRTREKEKEANIKLNKKIIDDIQLARLKAPKYLSAANSMIQLNQSGKMNSPAFTQIMKKVGFDWMLNPATKAYEKTLQTFLDGLKDRYGARISNLELEQFIKGLPDLINNPASRDITLQLMKQLFELQGLDVKIFDAIMGKTDGFIPHDLGRRMDIFTEPLLQQFNNNIHQINQSYINQRSFNNKPITNFSTQPSSRLSQYNTTYANPTDVNIKDLKEGDYLLDDQTGKKLYFINGKWTEKGQ